MTTTEIVEFWMKRATAAEWVTANPILAVGEPGMETDTGVFKIGDGVTAWISLPSQISSGLYDAKGDLIVASADNTPLRLAVGPDGQVLMADTASAGGLKYSEPGATPTQNTQTGTTYSAVLLDAGKTVTLSNASAVTLTIPAQASVAWAANTQLNFLNIGAGTVTITPAADVTINGTPLTLETSKGGSLVRTASNTWTFIPFSGLLGNAVFSDTETGQYTTGGKTYKYYVFNSSNTLTCTTDGVCDTLVIGGGGSGGGTFSGGTGGGGGGGGGFSENIGLAVAGTVRIIVGAGGSGFSGVQGNGSTSAVVSDISTGAGVFGIGGGGGGTFTLSPQIGGNGGGAKPFTSGSFTGASAALPTGFAGGNSTGGSGRPGGGGGGAGAVGANTSGSVAGVGGAGKNSSFNNNTATTYAGGGGGGAYAGGGGTAAAGGSGGGGAGSNSDTGAAGTTNLGGGGGGGRNTGGNGGSGFVVVRTEI